MQRIGVSLPGQNDRDGQLTVTVFRQRLQELGWTEGRNIEVLVRWGESKQERVEANARELVALRPDVIYASTTRVFLPGKLAQFQSCFRA
jgi:putative ABC transport system substrate-binding protein